MSLLDARRSLSHAMPQRRRIHLASPWRLWAQQSVAQVQQLAVRKKANNSPARSHYTFLMFLEAMRQSGNVSKWKPPEILQLRSQSRWKMPSEVRRMVLARDEETCWYCGACGDDIDITVDHWIPLCRGGTNKTVNLVCACSECNELKGNLMPDEFLAIHGTKNCRARVRSLCRMLYFSSGQSLASLQQTPQATQRNTDANATNFYVSTARGSAGPTYNFSSGMPEG